MAAAILGLADLYIIFEISYFYLVAKITLYFGPYVTIDTDILFNISSLFVYIERSKNLFLLLKSITET